MAEVKDYVFVNPEVSQKLEEMWNNQEFSDTLFLVNDVQFHASSHLVSVTSNILKTMLDTHFKHCGDREMRIGSIKHDESFSVILKYIYGMGINFSQMDRAVLCEVVCQSERFELTSFSKVLKSYLSELDCFALDSAVILLNTAKKYDIKKLYEKLTLFAFEKADQLVKHETFINLQYDVLLDFLKADNFCAPEIDIFMAALAWHNDNMSKSPSISEETLEKSKDTESVAKEEDASGDIQSESCEYETSLAEVIDSQSNEEGGEMDCVRDEDSIKGINADNTSNSALVIPNQTDTCTEVMKTFSDNVLKSLLSHIRIKQIPTYDFLNAFKSELVKKHTKVLVVSRIFSPNCESRSKNSKLILATPAVNSTVQSNVHVITKKFTFSTVLFKASKLCESKEEYFLGGMKWKVCLEDSFFPIFKLDLYLKCISDKECDWTCSTECQLRVISHNAEYPDIVIPSDDKYISVAFTPGNDCVKIGEHSFPHPFNIYKEVYYKNPTGGFNSNYTMDIKVHFKSILSEEKCSSS